jgi:hypothetical protein
MIPGCRIWQNRGKKETFLLQKQPPLLRQGLLAAHRDFRLTLSVILGVLEYRSKTPSTRIFLLGCFKKKLEQHVVEKLPIAV